MNLTFLTSLFSEFQNIFRSTMEELFVNKCLCEETSLYFFVIEISEGSKQACFVNARLLTEDICAEGKKTYDELIREFLTERFEARRYMLWESDHVLVNNKEYKIFWVFFSECADSNNGRFLLRCVLEELAEDFNKRLKSVSGDMTESVGSYHYLIQRIMQDATAKACLYLQKLYAPLNIPFIVELSGEYYEKSECRSNMVFFFRQAVHKIEEAGTLYYFENMKSGDMETGEIDFIPSNSRLIRKLLQIAQDDLCLIVGEDDVKRTFKVLGICKKSFLEEMGNEYPYIMIRFKNHMQWDMLENQTYIFSYRNGQYKIEREIHEAYLIRKLTERFGEEQSAYRDLNANIKSVIPHEHGTMLVIMDKEDAAREARRLGMLQQGFPTAQPEIRTEEIKRLSNIDGSIIIDTAGQIHGIGMILDGDSQETGNRARGARYNSAVKYKAYLEKNNIKSMILIISEDGPIDIM